LPQIVARCRGTQCYCPVAKGLSLGTGWLWYHTAAAGPGVQGSGFIALLNPNAPAAKSVGLAGNLGRVTSSISIP